MSLFITQKEAARELGVCLDTVKDWVRHGKLPTIRFGGKRRIPRAAFEAWRRSLTERALSGVRGDEERDS
jgi:excisionase family DNA binding protein